MLDKEGRLTYGSHGGLEIMGRAQADAAGTSWLERGFPPELRQQLQPQLQSVFETGRRLTGETTFQTGSGRSAFEYILSPVHGMDRRVDAVVITLRDIMERKQAEEDLRRARDELEIRVRERTAELSRASELLEKMFSSTGVMIAYMDRDFNFMGKPPALPGDAQSLTVPGICESLPSVNRSRRGVPDREAFNGRRTEFKPYGLELQVSRRMDTEVSQKGGLRRATKAFG
jgi:PAS domain S-box-containing protein